MKFLFAATTLLAAALFNSSTVFAESNYDVSSNEQRSMTTFPKLREVLQEGLNPHVGVTLGVSNPEGSYQSGAEYGVNFGFQPYIPFTLNMAMTFSQNNSKDAGRRSLDRTSVLVRGAYCFGGSTPLIKNSFVGIATGPIINQNATYFGIAPIAGFDIPVREWSGTYLSYLSVGAEAKYMMVSSGESDGLTVNGTLKYWF